MKLDDKLMCTHCPFEEIDDQVLVLVEQKNQIVTLNEVANFLWQNSMGCSASEVIHKLYETCTNSKDINYEDFENECAISIQNMVEMGIIRVIS